VFTSASLFRRFGPYGHRWRRWRWFGCALAAPTGRERLRCAQQARQRIGPHIVIIDRWSAGPSSGRSEYVADCDLDPLTPPDEGLIGGADRVQLRDHLGCDRFQGRHRLSQCCFQGGSALFTLVAGRFDGKPFAARVENGHRSVDLLPHGLPSRRSLLGSAPLEPPGLNEHSDKSRDGENAPRGGSGPFDPAVIE
jgi:hypothetical protein